jgi:hypothetical protein
MGQYYIYKNEKENPGRFLQGNQRQNRLALGRN